MMSGGELSAMSHKWSSSAKRTVALVVLVCVGLVLYCFRGVLLPLVLAFLLAFILDPVVDFLEHRLRLSRTLAAALVFALGGLILAAAPAVAVPPLVRAIRRLNLDFVEIAADLDRLLARPVVVLGFELELRSVYEQLVGSLEEFLSAVASGTLDVVVGFASTLFWVVFILLSAFYLVRDGERIVAWLDGLVPTSVRDDFVQLRKRIALVWNAFLRGQLLMALLLALITTVVATTVGLRNALALGLLAGAMEFVPNLGPIIAAVPAVLVAFFVGSSWIPLTNFWFAVLVLGLYLVIQQVEGNVLLPRILGRSLNLHPLIVLVAVIAGGSLAGVLGVLLAAPTVATLRVLMEYVYCRLTDRDPFPEAGRRAAARPGLGHRLWTLVRRRALAGQWVVRPARPEDRADVADFCSRIWPNDYVPEVWEAWLADPEGELTVVEWRERAVAVGKLTRLSGGEWWLEGLRVDPDFRRLGVARLLQARQIDVAERVGRGMLRLGTASVNRAVHRNLGRDGFTRVAAFCFCSAEPLPGSCPLRLLTPADLDLAWGLIEGSSIRDSLAGLYETIPWHWVLLTRERLAAHLAAGEVWAVDLAGQLAAVAVVLEDRRPGRLLAAYLDGQPEGLTALAWGLRVLAHQRGFPELRFRPPSHGPLIEALAAAGVDTAWEHEMWLFERPLNPEQRLAEGQAVGEE
jgi:predicted PurR-regulated permease PerM/GNAT superfamily N-acetyltransferase